MEKDGWQKRLANGQPKRKLISGVTGTGKTSLSKRLLKGCPRLLVQDPLFEWDDNCVAVDNYDDLYELIERPRFRIAVQIDEDPTEQAVKLAEIVQLEDVGRCVYVQDEIPLIYPNIHQVPDEIRDLVCRGSRRNDVSLIFITQRPINCPIIIRAMLTDIYQFRTHEPNDIKWLRAIVGKEQSEKVLHLRGHDYLHFDLTQPDAGVHTVEDDS